MCPKYKARIGDARNFYLAYDIGSDVLFKPIARRSQGRFGKITMMEKACE
jgi:hypothetical protein